MFFKGEIPFVRLLIPLIIGILSGIVCPLTGLQQLSVVAVASCLLVFMGIFISYKRQAVYRRKWVPGILVQLIIFFSGYLLCFESAEKYSDYYFSKFPSEALIITVQNEPQLSGSILRFESAVQQNISGRSIKNVSGRLLIALQTDPLEPLVLAYGDRLMIPSHYNEVDPPFNPGEFNFKAYLSNRQIYYQMFLNKKQVKVLNHQSGNRVLAFSIGLRKKLVARFYRFLHDEESAALASTLILGYRANLSKDLISAYSKTGTMHVLSVSGMHVGIIFIVLNFLLAPLRRHGHLRHVSALIIILLIWFYALITGFSPSVCRAALMLSFVVIGKAFNKNLNTYNLLAISAFFLLLYNPFYLLDVGFQLSYLAVIGLVYLQPKIYSLLHINNRILNAIWSYSALSIAAQLATFPISVYYFHQFPAYFLISNLLIVLPIALIMYTGIVFLFIPWLVILQPLGEFLNIQITVLNKILFYMEDLPFASVGSIWINPLQSMVLYLVIASIIWAALSSKKAAVYWTLASLFLFSVSITFKNVGDHSGKRLIFYSLRKNSALGFISNKQAYLISDLANNAKDRLFSINPALESSGVAAVKDIKPAGCFLNQEVQVTANYLQFAGLRVIRWDKSMDDLVFQNRAKADIVLISGNPGVNIKDINEHVSFSTVVIDATNYDYRVKRWQEEARLLKIPVHVLKKQPAYLIAW
jgi:competence protein ComEC